jgi:hypothetical protein
MDHPRPPVHKTQSSFEHIAMAFIRRMRTRERALLLCRAQTNSLYDNSNKQTSKQTHTHLCLAAHTRTRKPHARSAHVLKLPVRVHLCRRAERQGRRRQRGGGGRGLTTNQRFGAQKSKKGRVGAEHSACRPSRNALALKQHGPLFESWTTRRCVQVRHRSTESRIVDILAIANDVVRWRWVAWQ